MVFKKYATRTNFSLNFEFYACTHSPVDVFLLKPFAQPSHANPVYPASHVQYEELLSMFKNPRAEHNGTSLRRPTIGFFFNAKKNTKITAMMKKESMIHVAICQCTIVFSSLGIEADCICLVYCFIFRFFCTKF